MQQNKNLNTVKIIKSLLFTVIASFIFLLPFYMEGLNAIIVQDFGVMTHVQENFPNPIPKVIG